MTCSASVQSTSFGQPPSVCTIPVVLCEICCVFACGRETHRLSAGRRPNAYPVALKVFSPRAPSIPARPARSSCMDSYPCTPLVGSRLVEGRRAPARTSLSAPCVILRAVRDCYSTHLSRLVIKSAVPAKVLSEPRVHCEVNGEIALERTPDVQHRGSDGGHAL